jgi:acetyl esterase/lipase
MVVSKQLPFETECLTSQAPLHSFLLKASGCFPKASGFILERSEAKMRTSTLLAMGLTCLCVAWTASVTVAQDRSKYPTHLNSSSSGIDWIAFYDRIDALTAATQKELQHHLDLSYGEDPRQKLDLYLPQNEAASPVFIFIHGGGFVEGDREHYGYVARPLAAQGIVTVVMSYRLSPTQHYPEQVYDVQAVLGWVYRNIEEYGGDASQIYIGGHSAGAILSAFVSVNNTWLSSMSLPGDLIKGYVPISGPYDLRKMGDFVDNYFSDDTKRVEASPVLNIRNVLPKAVVAVGALEKPYLESSQEFVQALNSEGGDAKLLVLEGMTHDATALSAADEDGPLVRALIELIESNRQNSSVQTQQ